ncbi:hypothetical protein GN244_ATG03113 [Phytophthora infestans]|uniref:Transmembrane protein n=2 Tax=Phytophthora infestans TaxID=4787 RepID=A0A833WKQ2_PHYIN|nr:hypothetical protein GN244_ATG03113 [Phytophthora infestans]
MPIKIKSTLSRHLGAPQRTTIVAGDADLEPLADPRRRSALQKQQRAYLGSMIVVFGSSNAFGRDVNEMEMMVLAGTVFVVSVLLVLVYKLARGWDDLDKDDFGASVLPMHAPRATNRWVSSRKTHFGRLGTIQENEVFSFSSKMR